MRRSADRDRDRCWVPKVELGSKVDGVEVNRPRLVGRAQMSEEGSLARRWSPAVEVKEVVYDGGVEVDCEASPAFGLCALLLSFPERFLKFHYEIISVPAGHVLGT